MLTPPQKLRRHIGVMERNGNREILRMAPKRANLWFEDEKDQYGLELNERSGGIILKNIVMAGFKPSPDRQTVSMGVSVSIPDGYEARVVGSNGLVPHNLALVNNNQVYVGGKTHEISVDIINLANRSKYLMPKETNIAEIFIYKVVAPIVDFVKKDENSCVQDEEPIV